MTPGHVDVLERLLRHDRAIVLAGLLVACAASWAWIAPMAGDMYGAMTGPSAWMMTMTWDAPRLVALWAMWAVMMAAMMLPSASPMILMYVGMAHRGGSGQASIAGAYLFAGGYLAVWALFSVGATALQRVFSRLVLLTPMMEPAHQAFTAGILIVAGVYQLTPLKHRCLRSCRSPLSFLMTRWKAGRMGAFSMGISHGTYCLGCCWALMLLLFAAGVMNLVAIVALTIFVVVEKTAPAGWRIAEMTGAVLVAFGLWLALE